MRRCGAAARTMLEQAAAEQWKVPVGECHAQLHKVIHKPTGRELGYDALATAAGALAVPARDSVRLKDPAEFRYIGKEGTKAIDGADIVNGRAIYGADVHFDGMLTATIARPAVYGGKVKSLDDSAAESPGRDQGHPDQGRRCLRIPAMGGVAVVASSTWAAIRAATH